MLLQFFMSSRRHFGERELRLVSKKQAARSQIRIGFAAESVAFNENAAKIIPTSRSTVCLLVIVLGLSTPLAQAWHSQIEPQRHAELDAIERGDTHSASHQHETHDEHEEDSRSLHLSPQSQALSGIKTTSLTLKPYYRYLTVPGEIKANGYSRFLVAPRTDSQVLKRHVVLGQTVSAEQALVTLFSAAMAQAQTELQMAFDDWQRVERLGLEGVSDSRRFSDRARYHAALAKVRALGLSDAEINAMLEGPTESPKAGIKLKLGEYQLRAQGSGVVLADDFLLGQQIPAGQIVMEIADESRLWVEARLPSEHGLRLVPGGQVRLIIAEREYQAQVVQIAHSLDTVTRTRLVRLEVANPDDSLHAGMFASVTFSLPTEEDLLAVPESALIQEQDGAWQVFIQTHEGEFVAKDVELGVRLGTFRQISGLQPGTQVVSRGAFFLASQMAKASFDPHNH